MKSELKRYITRNYATSLYFDSEQATSAHVFPIHSRMSSVALRGHGARSLSLAKTLERRKYSTRYFLLVEVNWSRWCTVDTKHMSATYDSSSTKIRLLCAPQDNCVRINSAKRTWKRSQNALLKISCMRLLIYFLKQYKTRWINLFIKLSLIVEDIYVNFYNNCNLYFNDKNSIIC